MLNLPTEIVLQKCRGSLTIPDRSFRCYCEVGCAGQSKQSQINTSQGFRGCENALGTENTIISCC
ncbi:MAG: hypothetical protein U0354_10930 [Candidatus Sericytochromatia bacterium]